jgi:hypothetical protein
MSRPSHGTQGKFWVWVILTFKNLYASKKAKPLPEKIETQKNKHAVSKPLTITQYYVNVGLPFVRLVAWATKSIFSRGVSRIRERNDDRRGEGSKLFRNLAIFANQILSFQFPPHSVHSV